MVIGIDLRVLARGIRSGIEVYAYELTKALVVSHPESTFRLFHNAFKKHDLPEDMWGFPNAKIVAHGIPNKVFEYFFDAPFVPSFEQLAGWADVLLSPHFLPLRTGIPQTVVVHDLSFIRHPEFFSFRKKYWHWLVRPRAQVARAARIIAVSESTKADLIELWNIAPENISVVYPGIDHERFRPRPHGDPNVAGVKKKYNLPDRFILFIGVLEPRKNILGLIKAFELLTFHSSPIRQTQGKLFTHHLVLAGPRGWGDTPILRVMRNSPARNRIHYIGFVPEEDKPALYNLADLFVYPSFFEGFGFPPLEAMASGVPVISSNRSSIPEGVGDAAVMVDPYDITGLADATSAFLESSELCIKFREKGLKHAQQFTWHNTAQQVMTILQNAAVQ